MKKLILTLLATGFIFSASAQFQLGVKAGVNFSTLNIDAEDASDDLSTRVGVHLGVYGLYMFSDKLGIQPELLYSSEGMKYDLGGDEYGKWVLNYLQLPVLLRFQPTSNFNIHAGPQFGFKLSGKDKIDQYNDDIDILNDFMFSIAGGIGYNFTEKIELGARYTASLSDIMDDSFEFNTSSRVIQVFASFRLK